MIVLACDNGIPSTESVALNIYGVFFLERVYDLVSHVFWIMDLEMMFSRIFRRLNIFFSSFTSLLFKLGEAGDLEQ